MDISDTDSDEEVKQLLCSICQLSLDFHLYKKWEHPVLSVKLCGLCYDEVTERISNRTSDELSDYCMWCCNDGILFLCDSCDRCTCDVCIRTNFGDDTLSTIENAKTWKCFECDPSSLGCLRFEDSNEEDSNIDTDVLCNELSMIEDELQRCAKELDESVLNEKMDLIKKEISENSENKSHSVDVMEELNIHKEMWEHHEGLIRHRQTEIQDILESRGLLYSFYLLRETSGAARGDGNGSGNDTVASRVANNVDSHSTAKVVDGLNSDSINHLFEEVKKTWEDQFRHEEQLHGKCSWSNVKNELDDKDEIDGSCSEEEIDITNEKHKGINAQLLKWEESSKEDVVVAMFDEHADIPIHFFPPQITQKYPLRVLKALHYCSKYIKYAKLLDALCVLYSISPEVRVIAKYILDKVDTRRSSLHPAVYKAILSSTDENELKCLQGHYGLAEHSAETEVIANMDDDDVMDLCHEDITDSSTSARPFHSVMHTEESDKSLEKRKNKRRKVQLKRPKTESPLDSSPASQQLKLKSSNGSVQKVPKNKGKSVNDAICLISDDEEEVHSIAENGSDEIEVIVPEGEINASSDPRVVLKRWSELFRQYPPINKGAVSTKKPIIAPTIPKTKLVSPSPQSLTTSSKIDEDDYIDTPPFVVNVNDSKKTEPTIVIGGYISYKLKPHQKEAVQFMWTSIMGTNILSNLKEVVSSNTSTDSNVDTFQNKKLIKRREDIVNGSGCILAHCMGLGKSFSVIALVITLFTNEVVKSELRLKDRPLIYRVLMVVPVNIVHNWKDEFNMWTPSKHSKSFNVNLISSDHSQKERSETLKRWYDKGGVCIMGYELFRDMLSPQSKSSDDRDSRKLSIEDYEQYLLKGPDLVVADEAHRLKDKTSRLSECLNRIQTKRRIALTGSPLQNNLLEYFHMVQFVKAGVLGTETTFKKSFLEPIAAGESKDASNTQKKKMKGRIHVLRKKLKDVIQRKDINELSDHLPHKREFVICVKMTPFQKSLYKMYLTQFHAENNTRNIIMAYQPMLKIWNHPVCLAIEMGHNFTSRGIAYPKKMNQNLSLSVLKNYMIGRFQEFITASNLDITLSQKIDDDVLETEEDNNNDNDNNGGADGGAGHMDTSIEEDGSPNHLGDYSDNNRSTDEDIGDDNDSDITRSHASNDDDEANDDIAMDITDNSICKDVILETSNTDQCNISSTTISKESKEPTTSIITTTSNTNMLESTKISNVEMVKKSDSVIPKSDSENKTSIHTHEWWYIPPPAVNSASTNGVTFSDSEFVHLGGKVVLFLSLLAESIAIGDKMVIFSQSISTLDFLQLILQSDWGKLLEMPSNENIIDLVSDTNALKNWRDGRHFERIDGTVSASKRREKINNFKVSKSCKLFLISTKAGNMGINLQSANRVIIFDSSWNPANDLQATFRCYRFGQTKDVFVYRFLASGTMEEKIYKKQVKKLSLSLRVIDEHMPENQFQAHECEELLGYNSDSDDENDNDDEVLTKLDISDASDKVLNQTATKWSKFITRLYDMDPLLEDKEDEHLNESEIQEAEKSYNEELATVYEPNGFMSSNMQTIINQGEKSMNFPLDMADPRGLPPGIHPGMISSIGPSGSKVPGIYPFSGPSVNPIQGISPEIMLARSQGMNTPGQPGMMYARPQGLNTPSLPTPMYPRSTDMNTPGLQSMNTFAAQGSMYPRLQGMNASGQPGMMSARPQGMNTPTLPVPMYPRLQGMYTPGQLDQQGR